MTGDGKKGVEPGRGVEELPFSRVVPGPSLRETVIELLKESIISGTLRPGQPLRERDLAQAFGTSTTPVKEALQALRHIGLVVTVPRRGTYVSESATLAVSELFTMRAAIEALAARFAASNATPEQLSGLGGVVERMEQLVEAGSREALVAENAKFHAMIRALTRNPFLDQILETVVVVDRAARTRALRYREEMELGLADHVAIYEAIRDHQLDVAEIEMRRHILRRADRVFRREQGGTTEGAIACD